MLPMIQAKRAARVGRRRGMDTPGKYG